MLTKFGKILQKAAMIVFLSWLAVPAQAEQTSLSYEQFFCVIVQP